MQRWARSIVRYFDTTLRNMRLHPGSLLRLTRPDAKCQHRRRYDMPAVLSSTQSTSIASNTEAIHRAHERRLPVHQTRRHVNNT